MKTKIPSLLSAGFILLGLGLPAQVKTGKELSNSKNQKQMTAQVKEEKR